MTQLTFDEADAIDVGGIDDPLARLLNRPSRFHMTRTRITDGPMRIDFCRIEAEAWLQIVVALGDWPTRTPPNEGPYTCYVDDGAGTSETISLPVHAWRSRWQWQNKPWPFPPTPLEELYQAKLLPRFDPALIRGNDRYHGPLEYEPLGLAGFTSYMPQTGGRDDIGPVTGPQGWYLVNEGDAAALADVMAQGYAGASYPWDFHDPQTGALLDPIIAYPTASLDARAYPDPQLDTALIQPVIAVTLVGPAGMVLSGRNAEGQGPFWNFVSITGEAASIRIPESTQIPASGMITVASEWGGTNVFPTGACTVVDQDQVPVPGVTATLDEGSFQYGSLMTLDSAHCPSTAYVPFLLSGMPDLLYTLQCQAVVLPILSIGCIVRTGTSVQSRDLGWSARTLAQAARVSPDNPPQWLLPRSVFMAGLDQWEPKYRADTSGNTKDPSQQVLHVISYAPDNGQYQQWQEDIALNGLSWIALLHPGMAAWRQNVDWLLQQSRARLDVTSGWATKYPTAYTTVPIPAPGQPLFPSWAAMWAGNAGRSDYPGSVPGETPQDLVLSPGDDYASQMSAAMNLAWQCGITSAAAEAARLNGALPGRSGKYAIAGPMS